MQIKNNMMRPVSIAGLVWFRILFGSIMMWEVYRYFSKGWIKRTFVYPEFHFKFYGFDWLPDIAGEHFYKLWALLGVFAFLITIGCLYRFSIVLFTVIFSYIFLIEQANYLNHFYFVCLMSFAMCFIDPHRAFSIDSLGLIKKSAVVPFWQHMLLCFIMGVVYFYGGLAKIDPDWMTGVPLSLWLDKHGGFLERDITALFFSWSGVLLDLFIVPAIIYKRTRLIAFVCISAFHIANHFLFQIGIFPWFSIATTLLFFGPDFPIKFLKKLGLNRSPFEKLPELVIAKPSIIVQGVLLFFVAYNMLMPLRHHFYPGDVHWTERGHMFSWRMKLRSKRGSTVTFHITDLKTGEKWRERATKRLTRKQSSAMKTRPEMIIEYVKYLKKVLKQEGHDQLNIRVQSRVSLNNRSYEALIKQDYNMANVNDCVFCAPAWINNPELGRSWSDSYYRLKERLASGK